MVNCESDNGLGIPDRNRSGLLECHACAPTTPSRVMPILFYLKKFVKQKKTEIIRDNGYRCLCKNKKEGEINEKFYKMSGCHH